MAAGFLATLAAGAVEVRSAGRLPADQVNSAAVEAMHEVGIDISEQTPKLLTTDAVQASDVVITMGCGDSCPVFPGTRYLDWDLPDPAGKGVEAVRPIRDEIRSRVEALLTELQPRAGCSPVSRASTRLRISSRIGRTASTPLPAGSGRSQSRYRLPGKTGQVSPQPMVMTTSLAWTASVVRSFGVCSEMSMPTSCMASTAAELTWSVGRLPAERTSTAPAARVARKPAAIWERPALCTQRNRTAGLSDTGRPSGRERGALGSAGAGQGAAAVGTSSASKAWTRPSMSSRTRRTSSSGRFCGSGRSQSRYRLPG